jgi:hypothetical protein
MHWVNDLVDILLYISCFIFTLMDMKWHLILILCLCSILFKPYTGFSQRRNDTKSKPNLITTDSLKKYLSIVVENNTIKQIEIRESKEETFLGLNFNEIGIIVQVTSLIGLIITLAYLAKQNAIANKNNMISAFQHSMDSINEFNNVIAESSDLAGIIVRGRISFSQLSEEEKLRFEHTYGRLLNIVEAWHSLAEKTAISFKDKQEQVDNVKAVVQFYFNYPGVLEFWEGYKSMYLPTVSVLIDENTTVVAATSTSGENTVEEVIINSEQQST